MTCTKRLNKKLRKFAESTSIHGLPHIPAAKSLKSQLFWASVFLLCALMFWLQTFLLIQKFFLFEKTVQVEVGYC